MNLPPGNRPDAASREPPLLAEGLQSVTEAALAHLDLDDLLSALLERIRGIMSVDAAAILLTDEDGEALVPRAVRGVDTIEEALGGVARIEFARQVATTGGAVGIEGLRGSSSDGLGTWVGEGGIRSLCGVPLVVEGRLVGVLQVATVARREFSAEDTLVLEALAERAAVAIDRARLHESEHAARSAAEMALQLENLQEVTESSLAYLDIDDLLGALLERITGILSADTAAILLTEEDGETLAPRALRGLDEELGEDFRVPVGIGFSGRVAATRGAVAIEDLDRTPIEVTNPLLLERRVRSVLGVPMVVEGRLIGVLYVGTALPRRFSASDAYLLQLVADRAALAIERDRLGEQDRIARTLQRSILPTEVPKIPGVAIAARYLPAATQAAVGGDWYDVIPLGDGKVGFAIGDVVGRGVQAAALMGQLRTALHAYAIEGGAPADIAARLARFTESLGEDAMATFVYAILDLDNGLLEFVNGGHPSPLLISPDSGPRHLDGASGPPLGVRIEVPFEPAETALPPGSMLFLYTDGLVERRGERLDDRDAALTSAAAAAPFDVDLLCDAVSDEMLEGAPTGDDVALLAVQNLGYHQDRLELTVPARVRELAAVRRSLRRWLLAAGATEDDVSAIVLACNEACANAIEHAYGPGDATFELHAGHRDGVVSVTVSDSGSWRASRGENRGRGMLLMRAFTDDLEIRSGETGTTVTIRRGLGERP
jgi:GAF domain-containing protein/anti-sigma regulatory factor (Ser/Thr protein kinase)